MADRTQINFRIDNDLLEAIKARCEAEDLTQTEFIINAIKSALGMAPVTSSELDKLLEAKLASIEERLEQRLESRLAALEEALPGKPRKKAA